MATLANHFRRPLLLTTREASAGDAFLFGLVCTYWLSQAFLIPILPLGPWPVWPTFADFIVPPMVLGIWWSPRRFGSATWLVRAVAGVTFICFGSLAVAVLIHGSSGSGILFGMGQLYRVVQAVIVLVSTAKLELTPRRIEVLRSISFVTFVAISFSIFVTAFGLVSTSTAALMLPAGVISGPWNSYVEGMIEGVGFISTNHGYTAIQLLLSLGLLLSLNKLSSAVKAAVYLIAVSAAFVTRSRSGFVCMLILLIAIEIKRSRVMVIWLAAVVFLVGSYLSSNEEFRWLTERQLSSASTLQDDGLSGRTDIWKDYGAFLIAHPVTLFTGVGFGFAVNISPYNAHLLYLHIVAEMGILGLFAFFWFHRKLLSSLARKKAFAMAWTVVALLLTGLTQETLYPVIIFTHFIAFYLSANAAVLRINSLESITVREDEARSLLQQVRL
jgi:O-antigen ligase/polysaccharide polymerase Wzy-like membrane protein